MRERKLRSTAESLVRLRKSLIPYTHYIYKIQRKVKSKNTMRICSLSVPPSKHEWNQTVWSVNNLRCGTAELSGPFPANCPRGYTRRVRDLHMPNMDGFDLVAHP